MNGTATYEDRLAQADPARHAAYISLRERDARCDSCRATRVCPDAWQGAYDCPDLDHLMKGEDK